MAIYTLGLVSRFDASVFLLALTLAACGSAVDADSDGSTTDAASSSSSSSSGGPASTSSTSSSSTSSADSSSTDPDDSTTSTGGESSSSTGNPSIEDPGCPECIVLVDELVGGRGIALDQTHVYFTDQSQGTVHRIMKGGGDGGILVDGQDTPYDVAVDDTHVYWTNFADDGAVMRAPKDGGRPEVIATASRPRPVAVNDTHVFWGTFEIDDGEVYRQALGVAEPPEQLAELFGGISEMVLGDDRVYWTSHAEDGGGAFIIDPDDQVIGGVFSAVLDGSADPFDPAVLVTDQASPWGLARTSTGQLLWANGDGPSGIFGNRLMTLNAGDPPTPLYSASAAPWGVAADEALVYWTDNELVMAIALEGGEAIELAELQNSARSIAVDDDDVFWITRNRVLQRPKPE